MPHRQQEFLELCQVCKQRTDKGCLRCGIPLCANHAPGRRRRCTACEAEFRANILRTEVEQADYWLDKNGALLPLALVALSALWLKTFVKWIWIKGFSGHRRRFLAERKQDRLLSE